jgi:hypothetical protein
MKTKIAALAAAALFAIVGCSRAESPSEVRHDVTEAKQDAAEKTAKAREEVREERMDAQQDINKDMSNAAEKTQQSEYDLAIAKAEGDAKVAREQCEALSGDAQEACKQKADADLEVAKANAKAMYPNRD